MRGATGGVQRKVQDVFPNAHYVHCYAHQFNLVMQQATSHIPQINHFFSDMGDLLLFFTKSSKRTAVFDEMVAHRLPSASSTRWNFNSRAVNTVYEHKDDLVRCFQTIRNGETFDGPTKREAGGYVRMLEDEAFCFFLALFHKIMPHVDILYNQLQKRNIDSVYIAGIIQTFIDHMQAIRKAVPNLVEDEEYKGPVQEPPTKKRRTLGEDTQHRLALEVCDTIMSHAKERFSFTKHLVSATLLKGDLFQQHRTKFPHSALEDTVEAYPSLDKVRLKTELSEENEEFKSCSGALALYQVLMENNLQDTLTETVSLLNILITTPMTTSESERCFSTLNRIKTFLRNTMAQDWLNALAMLSIEKKLTRDIPDFNTRVIEKFANQKDRRAKFLYK
ncbi:hypothetical protein ACEWY4_016917 [Coilia grayii]|uniref:HAT C-terminal dimerisation domain-containing protein n=1 Tax=Coilia grayii TaxID=363190 RepID=A0ABD1JMQ0_9TELE